MSEAVRPAPPTTAGDTSTNNERVNPIVTIQEGESEQVGNEATSIPNGDADSTGTLKDQVSEFRALQMRSNKEQMPALSNCKEVSPLSICPSTAECPWPALQEAACLSHERAEGEEGGLL